MANYNQVSYGSKGNDVTELQKMLNQNGYNLDTDGIFGAKTQAAVKDYQKKSGLDVDGIVGQNTWGSLTGSKPGQNAEVMGTSTGAAQPTSNGFQYAGYQESDTVKQAEQMLNEQLANKPGEYQSQWQTQLNDTLNKILNREKFSYDLNGDALYQQYKDKYIQQGKMAMMDTMGQAQAMTGGYGNSYAQSVGQQAYQGYLQQLNDKIPELYQLAYDQYNQEGQDLLNQYSILGAQEEQDYGRYRDSLSDWQAERDYLTGRYDSERDYDYGKYTDERDFNYGSYIDDRNYQYQLDRDAIADAQWQKEFDEAKRQYDEGFAYQKDRDVIADEQWAWEQEQALAGSGNDEDDGDGTGSDENEFQKAIFARVDDNGNYVFYIDGKERTYAPGVNPYTGTKNSDVQYGTFGNGYQPNNLGVYKVNDEEVVNTLSKSGFTDVVNGVTQNVWVDKRYGKLWIWDGTLNKYKEYDDGSMPIQGSSGSELGGGGGKVQYKVMN